MMMGRVFVSAKTYVKDYGWHKAKEMLNKARGCGSIKVSGYFFLYDDLERLVKSYELVQQYGGLNGIRNTLNLLTSSVEIGLYHGVEGINVENEVPRLKQAIADVESCL